MGLDRGSVPGSTSCISPFTCPHFVARPRKSLGGASESKRCPPHPAVGPLWPAGWGSSCQGSGTDRRPPDRLSARRPVRPSRPGRCSRRGQLARLGDPQRLQCLPAVAGVRPLAAQRRRRTRPARPRRRARTAPGSRATVCRRAAGPVGSVEVIGVRSSRPTDDLVAAHRRVPCRTSYPAPLQRVAVAVASMPSSRVSSRGGCVDVSGLAEHRGPGVRPGRVHLHHLAAGHPAHHVEVVHQGVPVEPAGERQVCGGRRRRVGGDGPHGVQPAQRARSARLPRGGVPRVEAAHEAQLEDAAGRSTSAGRPGCPAGRGRSASRRRPAVRPALPGRSVRRGRTSPRR